MCIRTFPSLISTISHSRCGIFGYSNVPMYEADMFAERSQGLQKYTNAKACMPVASYHAILRLKNRGYGRSFQRQTTFGRFAVNFEKGTDAGGKIFRV